MPFLLLLPRLLQSITATLNPETLGRWNPSSIGHAGHARMRWPWVAEERGAGQRGGGPGQEEKTVCVVLRSRQGGLKCGALSRSSSWMARDRPSAEAQEGKFNEGWPKATQVARASESGVAHGFPEWRSAAVRCLQLVGWRYLSKPSLCTRLVGWSAGTSARCTGPTC